MTGESGLGTVIRLPPDNNVTRDVRCREKKISMQRSDFKARPGSVGVGWLFWVLSFLVSQKQDDRNVSRGRGAFSCIRKIPTTRNIEHLKGRSLYAPAAPPKGLPGAFLGT